MKQGKPRRAPLLQLRRRECIRRFGSILYKRFNRDPDQNPLPDRAKSHQKGHILQQVNTLNNYELLSNSYCNPLPKGYKIYYYFNIISFCPSSFK